MAKQAWDEVSTAQVIPGELTAQIYRHTIPYSQPVPCWTYVTQGLMAHQQKELVITLKRTDATGGEKAPDFVLRPVGQDAILSNCAAGGDKAPDSVLRPVGQDAILSNSAAGGAKAPDSVPRPVGQDAILSNCAAGGAKAPDSVPKPVGQDAILSNCAAGGDKAPDFVLKPVGQDAILSNCAAGEAKAPDFVLELLKHIFRLAKQGRTVDAGGYTSMTLAGAAKKEGLPFNLLYLDPIPLPGIPVPSPALTVRFMSVEEHGFFQAFGSMRLIAAWAQHYHYVPAPPWSEMPAPQVVSVERFQTSILNKTARAHLPQSTVNLEGKEIVFRLQPGARAALAGHLDQLPPLQPVAFLPNLDRQADSGLAWIPEQNQTAMNITPTSRRSRIAGCFMLFIPAQQAVSARVFEDGFALLLPTETWEDIRAAMVKGEARKVNTSGTSWRMEWKEGDSGPITTDHR